MRANVSVLCLMLLLTACDQPPSRVEDKGKNSYTKNGVMMAEASASDYSYAPVSEPLPVAPQSTISVQSIESKDLSAPTAAPAPALKPAAPVPHASGSTFKMPVDGKIISKFGVNKNDGINIAAIEGTPVRASASGSVVFVGNQLKSYGNMVIIKHEDRRNTTYAHMGKTFVSKGQHVAQGDSIGTVGKTGTVKTPQLHFALREGATPRDPMRYMPTMTSKL